MANNTRLEIRNEVYYLMSEPTDGADEFGETRINSEINRVQDMVIKGSIKSELDGTMLRAPDLRFMRKKSFITRHEPKPLTTAITATTDTTIYVDASDFESSGYVMIEGDVIKYTGKTATTLTGVTDIDTTHAISKDVRQVYLIPATAWKTFGVEYITDEEVYDKNWLDEKDFRDNKDIRKYYSIVGNTGSNSLLFVDIHGYSNNDRFIIHYYAKATDMSTDASETDLPDKYGISVISTIVAGNILYFSDEVALGQSFLKKGYSNLETMYAQYNDQTARSKSSVQSPSINRGENYFRQFVR